MNKKELQKLLEDETDLEIHKIHITLNTANEHDRPIEILEAEKLKLDNLNKKI